MDFDLNEDQTAVLDALEQIVTSKEAGWAVSPTLSRFDWSQTLDATLEENGFFDVAQIDTLNMTTAVEVVYRLARLPVLVESAASCLLRARYFPRLPRPVAVVEASPDTPVRFLPVARSVIFLQGGEVDSAVLEPQAAEPVESIFAYPMGRLRSEAVTRTGFDGDASEIVSLWRIAVAAELAGTLRGGLDAVVEHVRVRHQFGRPLGSFQAIQHRLASNVVRIEGGRLLALRAAQRLDPADAVLALGYIQQAATGIIYDLHQFMGAMGLTLEHPLHRWTYRARLLRSSLGGYDDNYRQASLGRWGVADARPSSGAVHGDATG